MIHRLGVKTDHRRNAVISLLFTPMSDSALKYTFVKIAENEKNFYLQNTALQRAFGV